MDLEETIARLIAPGAFNCTYLGPHGAAYQAADQDQAREIAQNIIQGLGLHEQHRPPAQLEHGPWHGPQTRLTTNWQEDTQ